VSDASKEQFLGGGNFSGVEIESNSPGGRDPYTRFRAAMPTEGPLTDAGLEVWPRGIYDLISKISKDYDHRLLRSPRVDAVISMGRMKRRREHTGCAADPVYRETLAELARAIDDGARVRAFHAWTLLDNFQWERVSLSAMA